MGTITSVSIGIATLSGLPGVGFDELVKFPGGLYGIAFNVDADEIGVVLLGDYWHLHAGDEVERTGRVMDVPVGDGLIGRVIDPLGAPLDGKGPVAIQLRLPIERPRTAHHGPSSRHRAAADRPHGHRCADSHRPRPARTDSGRPADRQDRHRDRHHPEPARPKCAVRLLRHRPARLLRSQGHRQPARTRGDGLHRRGGGGRQRPARARLYRPLCRDQHRGAFHGGGPGCAHRLRRSDPARASVSRAFLAAAPPPGREAFPGDIFYIHSRLLERATHLRDELRGGSLTALPIIETEAEDISAYIPTNLISITDGQIYLSPTLFELGTLPAVDVGKSVSRVGGKAQLPAYRAVAGDLKLAYAQFSELESFAKFGTRLDEHTRKIIDHGQRIRAVLKQPELEPASVPEQIVILMALTGGLLDRLPLDKVPEAERALRKSAADIPAEIRQRFNSNDKMSDSDHKAILQIVDRVIAPFLTEQIPQPKSKP